MRWLLVLRLRLRSLLHGGAADRDLDDELADHLDRQIEQNVAAGMTPEAARTAALRAMGGIEQRKEEMRDERRVNAIENVVRDVRFAFRRLWQQPAFTLAAIVSLALGIGANTAMFQLLNALSFRSLPAVHAPGELVEVRLTGEGRLGRHTGRNRQVSLPQFAEIARRQQAFTSMLAFGDTRFNLAPSGEVQYVEGLWISGSFFDTLGVTPVVGRLIGPADDRPGCGLPGAVISHALWQRQFGGAADVVGKSLPLGADRVPILGVTPPEFFGLEVGRRFDVALPICSSGNDRRDHWWLAAIGRVEAGWTRAQAQAHLQGVIGGVQRDTVPATYRSSDAALYGAMRVEVVDARAGVSPLRRAYTQPLGILMAIATLVLLIAAVNLANLLLARAASREQEFTIRLAIGGTRGRVLQQVLTESMVLAGLGSAAAVGVAIVVSRSLLPLISTAVDPIYLDLSIDWRFFGFTMVTAIVTALIFGMAPALRAAHAGVARPGQRSASGERSSLFARRLLVSLQIAVTLVLLFGALLFGRSFRNLATADLGVRPDGVIVANVFFPEASFPAEKRRLAYRDVEDRLRALPGVARIAEAFTTPIGGSFSDREITVLGGARGTSYRNQVSPGYFEVLGTPIARGRDFDARDSPEAPPVAVVNEAFVERFLTGEPLGQRFGTVNDAGVPDTMFEVIGVVRNQKYMEMREPFPPIFYPASSQAEPGLIQRYVVQSTEPPARAFAAISAALNAVDPTIGVRYAPLRAQIANALLQEQLMARLSTLFGLVALTLALVGLYGVVSYSVASRRAEIGVRVALGASRPRILWTILRDVGWMLAFGVAAGCGLSLVAARGIGSLLFGLDPRDTTTLALSAALLALTGLLAAAVPARRAARIDPATTLRE